MFESTKQNGDVAEQRVILELLKRGHAVLKPIGDRLRYDTVADVDGRLVKIQTKLAFADSREPNVYITDIRRHQTNRKVYKFEKYSPLDFDVFLVWIHEVDVFYVFPSEVACLYKSCIRMNENAATSRHRARSAKWREAWHVLETPCRESVGPQVALIPPPTLGSIPASATTQT